MVEETRRHTLSELAIDAVTWMPVRGKKRRGLWLLDYAVISNHIHLCSKTPAERDRAECAAHRRPQIINIRPASVEGDQMAKKEIIQVNLAAANPNLSPATRFGDLVFVAGQTGRHPITGEVGKDVGEQTRYAIERIKMILATAGTSLDNVLTVLTHLTKREDLAAYNEEYGKFFPTNKPARTTVEAMLNFPELLVEITVTACIPE
jgi:enamine deaminase RidA (YjgF/YER057c/UK114 family)